MNDTNRLLSDFSTLGDLPYAMALKNVQEGVSGQVGGLLEGKTEEEMKDLILRYIREHGITCSLTDSSTELTNYIYHDMSGLSFISREGLFERDGFEELNIDAWNDVKIVENGVWRKTDYSFLDEVHALNIHERIFRGTKSPFDESSPRATADIGNGVRITAIRTPVVDREVGVISSIRKVNTSTLSPEILVKNGVLTQEMLDFLLLSQRHGASICVSGETGAGKTTLAGALLTIVSKQLRTITIEQGSREWNFVSRDETGTVTNSVVHLRTRFNESNPSQNIDQEMLVEDSLRLDPDIIAPGEMRGREAFEVMAAANTGHIIMTTVHSNGTEDTPERIITLAKKAYDMSDASLFKMCSRAFPILVHMELLADKRRRVTEIREVTGCVNGEIQSQMLYEFIVDDNIYKGDTCVETAGAFRRLAPISKSLAQSLLKKGAQRSAVSPYTRPVAQLREVINFE